MGTIVLYRDGDTPTNDYPDRIVSPTRPGSCCLSSMAALGPPWIEGRASLQYRRCARCGFTVRKVLATTPDPAILQSVRQAFQSLFGDRGVPRGEPRQEASTSGAVIERTRAGAAQPPAAPDPPAHQPVEP